MISQVPNCDVRHGSMYHARDAPPQASALEPFRFRPFRSVLVRISHCYDSTGRG